MGPPSGMSSLAATSVSVNGTLAKQPNDKTTSEQHETPSASELKHQQLASSGRVDVGGNSNSSSSNSSSSSSSSSSSGSSSSTGGASNQLCRKSPENQTAEGFVYSSSGNQQLSNANQCYNTVHQKQSELVTEHYQLTSALSHFSCCHCCGQRQPCDCSNRATSTDTKVASSAIESSSASFDFELERMSPARALGQYQAHMHRSPPSSASSFSGGGSVPAPMEQRYASDTQQDLSNTNYQGATDNQQYQHDQRPQYQRQHHHHHQQPEGHQHQHYQYLQQQQQPQRQQQVSSHDHTSDHQLVISGSSNNLLASNQLTYNYDEHEDVCSDIGWSMSLDSSINGQTDICNTQNTSSHSTEHQVFGDPAFKLGGSRSMGGSSIGPLNSLEQNSHTHAYSLSGSPSLHKLGPKDADDFNNNQRHQRLQQQQHSSTLSCAPVFANMSAASNLALEQHHSDSYQSQYQSHASVPTVATQQNSYHHQNHVGFYHHHHNHHQQSSACSESAQTYHHGQMQQYHHDSYMQDNAARGHQVHQHVAQFDEGQSQNHQQELSQANPKPILMQTNQQRHSPKSSSMHQHQNDQHDHHHQQQQNGYNHHNQQQQHQLHSNQEQANHILASGRSSEATQYVQSNHDQQRHHLQAQHQQYQPTGAQIDTQPQQHPSYKPSSDCAIEVTMEAHQQQAYEQQYNAKSHYTSLQQLTMNCDNYANQVSTTTATVMGTADGQTQAPNKLRSLKGRRGRPRKKGLRSKNKVNGKLWEFIRDLLLNERTNPSFIRWERREDGVFKFVRSDKVAKMWGERKQNPKMTYEKLSRAMRYYYKSKVLLPVFGRRLVYKFGPNATGWMPETSDNVF